MRHLLYGSEEGHPCEQGQAQGQGLSAHLDKKPTGCADMLPLEISKRGVPVLPDIAQLGGVRGDLGVAGGIGGL